jgi:hypothetical protein
MTNLGSQGTDELTEHLEKGGKLSLDLPFV